MKGFIKLQLHFIDEKHKMFDVNKQKKRLQISCIYIDFHGIIINCVNADEI